MPIDIDRFEDSDDLRERPTSERVVRFLLAHDDRAYTRGEIAGAIDANPETVGTNLTRLKDRGLVRHREPYWAITDDKGRTTDWLHARSDGVARRGDEETSRADAPSGSDRTSEDGDTEAMEGDDASPASSSTAETRGQPHHEAASAFFERIRDHLDDDLNALYLFGSVARDGATTGSDVDVLAVVENDADFAAVDDQLLELAYDVQLEYGVRVEVHSIRASEFAARVDRGDPFVRTVVEEGETGV